MIETFQNVTIYISGMFGISRIDCKTLSVESGVKYAQYNNAYRVRFLEKGKRKERGMILDYKPFLVVLDTKHAVNPDNTTEHADGNSGLLSYDPRFEPDFIKLIEGLPVLYSIGAETAKQEAS